MPPFSPYIEHQALNYCNVGSSNTFEERDLTRRERIDEEGEAACDWSGTEKQHQHYSYHYSTHNIESEEKCEAELIDRFETTKLDLDSVVDAFEENYHEEVNQCLHPQNVFPSVVNENALLSSTNASLFTIPERRVTFAGRIYMGTVMDDLDVKLIPHVDEYTSEDKRNMWYTKDDFKAMRESNLNAALIVSKDSELYCPYFLRGLEHLVEDYIDYHRSVDAQPYLSTNDSIHKDEVDTNQSYNYDHFRDPSSTAGSRRWDAVEAVLCEQDEQRIMSRKKYGVYYGGIPDPEKIRSVYALEGKTEISQSIAHANALRDEACAKEWLMGETANGQRESSHYYNEDADHCHQITTSSDELSKAVGRAFRNLLTPFMNIPDGDMYSKMGDEFFLSYE